MDMNKGLGVGKNPEGVGARGVGERDSMVVGLGVKEEAGGVAVPHRTTELEGLGVPPPPPGETVPPPPTACATGLPEELKLGSRTVAVGESSEVGEECREKVACCGMEGVMVAVLEPPVSHSAVGVGEDRAVGVERGEMEVLGLGERVGEA